jgi:chromosome segregation ATPase
MIAEQKRKEKEALDEQEAMLLKEKAAIEEKKIQLENEKAQLEALKQEAVTLKEELQNYKSKLEITSKEKSEEVVLNNETPVIPEEIKNDTENIDGFLKFINVAKIKGVLYKKYLDKIITINPNVILCRDDKNIIEIYYGPFENNETRNELLNKLVNSNFTEAYEVEFTKEEFDKRCNY